VWLQALGGEMPAHIALLGLPSYQRSNAK